MDIFYGESGTGRGNAPDGFSSRGHLSPFPLWFLRLCHRTVSQDGLGGGGKHKSIRLDYLESLAILDTIAALLQPHTASHMYTRFIAHLRL